MTDTRYTLLCPCGGGVRKGGRSCDNCGRPLAVLVKGYETFMRGASQDEGPRPLDRVGMVLWAMYGAAMAVAVYSLAETFRAGKF